MFFGSESFLKHGNEKQIIPLYFCFSSIRFTKRIGIIFFKISFFLFENNSLNNILCICILIRMRWIGALKISARFVLRHIMFAVTKNTFRPCNMDISALLCFSPHFVFYENRLAFTCLELFRLFFLEASSATTIAFFFSAVKSSSGLSRLFLLTNTD